jgi:hypothetical protein
MTQDKKLLISSQGEYVVPALAIVSLLISCVIVSSKKFFWNDELYSYYFLVDQFFTHMLGAFHDKINNTPPLYFLLGWLWARVFGSTELSLRLFSSLGMCIACATVWITLRRTYSFWSTSIGVLSIFCTSSLILSQNAEARMYGLFLAVCSLGLLQYDSINRISKPTWITLFSNICVHAAIVNTHLLGLFYSGAIILSLILRDRYLKVFRLKVYFSVVLGWLSLILYVPSFLNQSDVGNPRSWIPIPTLRDLMDVLSFSLLSFQDINLQSFINITILLLLALISGWQFLVYKNDQTLPSQRDDENRQKFQAETSLLIFAYAFLLVPVFVWIISRTVKPIFWDRYLIPSVLSWSILFAHLLSRFIFNSVFSNKFLKKLGTSSFFIATRSSIFLLGLTAVLLVQPIRYAKSIQIEQPPGLNDNKYGYRELPIAMQFSHDFLTRLHYSPDRDRYFFILDWQVALDSTSGLFPPQEYKHLEALKRSYQKLFKNNIIQSQEFLRMYNRFLVLTYLDYTRKCTLEKKLENVHCSRWLEMRIMSNHHYKVTPLGDVDDRKLLLVEKQE